MLSPKIETDRLILRRYEENDIEMQYTILTDERLAKYIKFPRLSKEGELECIKKWISEADTSKYEKWVITLKGSHIAIGNISVNGIEKKHVEDIIKLCGNNIGNKFLMPNKYYKISVKSGKVNFERLSY